MYSTLVKTASDPYPASLHVAAEGAAAAAGTGASLIPDSWISAVASCDHRATITTTTNTLRTMFSSFHSPSLDAHDHLRRQARHQVVERPVHIILVLRLE